MQLDREGIDDSSTGVAILKEHFLSNGLSNVAYNKLSKDIDSGDMNVDILCKCDSNELKMLAKDYKLTFLQQKAFVEAVKLLKNANASNSNNNNINSNNNNGDNSKDNNNNHNNDQPQAPKDQKILNEMKEARDKLRQFSSYNKKMKEENVSKISLLIDKLKIYGDKLKESIDNTVNNLIKNVKFLFFLLQVNCVLINFLARQFKQYLICVLCF